MEDDDTGIDSRGPSKYVRLMEPAGLLVHVHAGQG